MSRESSHHSAPSPAFGADDARALRRLSAVMRLLETLKEDELAPKVCREAVQLTGADYALLFLAAQGEHQPLLLGSTLPEEHRVRMALARAARQGDGGPLARCEAGPFASEDLRELFAGTAVPEDGTLAVVPLAAEMFSGVLVVGREPGTGALAEDAVRQAIAFGRVVTPVLRVVQLLGKYRELMIRDDQTQSFNRRYFESFLKEEFIRAMRYGSSLSLIFIDLDNLKRVNELHGHTMGSKAIRKVADRVMPLIRTVDKLFRYGGDEFCVVLPETGWQGALEVAERLRISVESAPFLQDVGGVELTASFGVASYPEHAGSREELVRAADAAMYRIKQSGKNSISVAGEPKAGERHAAFTAKLAGSGS
ncbi:MAG: GGDEF domain-containing protein [Planctomycetota bacterium]